MELTDGARFNFALQEAIFAKYSANAIEPEAGHLNRFRALATRHSIAA